MEKLTNEILQALQAEDKEKAVKLSLNALENKEISVVELYEGILAPALRNVIDEYKNEDDLIWREHVRSGIIRTIIESAYPYVMNARKEVAGEREKIIVMCPEHEDHELGAKMVSDFFKLEGFTSTFIGARTPIHTIIQAIDSIQPKYLCISVTNYYNIVSVKRTIQKIRERTNEDLVIVLGGRAINANPTISSVVGADLHIKDYESIQKLGEEVS
jgi:methanogenic corrinoid protein MtbC1